MTADPFARLDGAHAAIGNPPPTWRVRAPGGEIIAWGITESNADYLARAGAGDVAEVDPLGIPATENYPPRGSAE
jgi:hypothetical protein